MPLDSTTDFLSAPLMLCISWMCFSNSSLLVKVRLESGQCLREEIRAEAPAWWSVLRQNNLRATQLVLCKTNFYPNWRNLKTWIKISLYYVNVLLQKPLRPNVPAFHCVRSLRERFYFWRTKGISQIHSGEPWMCEAENVSQEDNKLQSLRTKYKRGIHLFLFDLW